MQCADAYTQRWQMRAELGDASLKRACESLWADVTAKRMYVTAGLGPSASNEGFTADYDLPNATAYAETCASVALIFWAQRMLHLDLDGKYADVLEQALFNGALTGLSRDGEHYFYSNPLDSEGNHQRWKWHTCPCCTMNSARLIASVGGYFCSTSDDGIAVHLYGGIASTLTIGGRTVHYRETSNYPGRERSACKSTLKRLGNSNFPCVSLAGSKVPRRASTARPSTSQRILWLDTSRSHVSGAEEIMLSLTYRCRPSAFMPVQRFA